MSSSSTRPQHALGSRCLHPDRGTVIATCGSTSRDRARLRVAEVKVVNVNGVFRSRCADRRSGPMLVAPAAGAAQHRPRRVNPAVTGSEPPRDDLTHIEHSTLGAVAAGAPLRRRPCGCAWPGPQHLEGPWSTRGCPRCLHHITKHTAAPVDELLAQLANPSCCRALVDDFGDNVPTRGNVDASPSRTTHCWDCPTTTDHDDRAHEART